MSLDIQERLKNTAEEIHVLLPGNKECHKKYGSFLDILASMTRKKKYEKGVAVQLELPHISAEHIQTMISVIISSI